MLPTFKPQDLTVQPTPQAAGRQGLHAWLERGWIQAGLSGPSGVGFPGDGWDACPVEGADLTHKGALLAAKALKSAPRKIAQAWVDALEARPFVEHIEIVGPGHVNFTLTGAARLALMAESGPFCPTPDQPAILIEFVSANPTGPLHLGHARQAALGSTLANLMRAHGWAVGTEFYSNDAGKQIDMLVKSVQLRMLEQQGVSLLFERNLDEAGCYHWDEEGIGHQTLDQLVKKGSRAQWFPKDGYHGQDIIEVAKSAIEHQIAPDDAQAVKNHAIETISKWQQDTLAHMRVSFDSFASERGLHESGEVERVKEGLRQHSYRALRAAQDTHEPAPDTKPAWFLRTTAFGDDKDRVAIKADGSVPYFVPDVAYHIDKYRRGWARALNIQGADHHGTLARVKAGVQFLGGPVEYPQAMFHTMVSVMKDDQPLVASKRAGTALPADTIVDLIGVDALRMSLLSVGAGSELTVDINAWQAQGLSNPVYAVQYAHARLCSMLGRASEANAGLVHDTTLTAQEMALAKATLVFHDKMQRAAVAMDPLRPVALVREIASLVHSAYEHAPKLVDLDSASRGVHVPVFAAARGALASGLGILGIEAPEQMANLTLKRPGV